MERDWRVRLLVGAVSTLAVVFGLSGTALAHGGALGGGHLSVSRSLAAGTGGLVVGLSLAVATLRSERGGLDALSAARRRLSLPGLWTLTRLARAVGVLGLLAVLVTGVVGPTDPISNPAVVLVWGGWWAGYAMSTYLVGNTWPALNPWRTVATPLAAVTKTYRWRWGAWPAVAALLALFWVQTVGPLATSPRLLAVVVGTYSVVTVAGAVVYGPDAWFGEVDPVARAFQWYGLVAPLGRDEGDLVVRAPGAALAEDPFLGADDVAFAVALFWGTVFDGFVTTPLWVRLANGVAGWGVPPLVLYGLALLSGFVVCWGLLLLAGRVGSRYLPESDLPTLLRRVGPGVLAVAAGYHFAHFFGYFLSLVPALAFSVTAPFAVVDPGLLVLPGWLGALTVVAVFLGHGIGLVAVRTAMRSLDGTDTTRAQYAFGAVLAGYSLLGLWVATSPELTPPFL